MKILSLDGGGAKGLYTLGVLLELEALIEEECNQTISEYFDVIYGTSTGSIIASLLALNENSVTDIKKMYLKLVPEIMSKKFKYTRSESLRSQAESIFLEKKFDSFTTADVCIVATNISDNKPLIFKSNKKHAHRGKASFEEGFGVKISEAVVASCSAYPLFEKVDIEIKDEKKTLIDGGFVANNPSLFAILDAIKEQSEEPIQMLSIGVGQYPVAKLSMKDRLLLKVADLFLTEKILECNSNINDFLVNNIFSNDSNIEIIRINETYSKDDYKTNLLEKDHNKLNTMYSLGKKSFLDFEVKLRDMYNLKKG